MYWHSAPLSSSRQPSTRCAGSCRRRNQNILVLSVSAIIFWVAGSVSQASAQGMIPITAPEKDNWSGFEELAPPLENSVLQVDQGHQSESIWNPGPVEMIQQRYSDGKIKIRREVVQDADGNYMNHGAWQLFDRNENVVAEGQFDKGRRQGHWRRMHAARSSGLFQQSPFKEFKGPYISVAHFKTGRLHGTWSVMDQAQRKIMDMSYSDGKRDGQAVWYWPNGSQMRQADFQDGQIHGQIVEWNRQNKVVRQVTYDQGKELIKRTAQFHPKQKESEANFLGPRLVYVEEDDWWNAQPASYESIGREIQHGSIHTWYSNGQPKSRGQFENGLRVGAFVFWHSNGQKQTEGRYRENAKTGRWTWWHQSGMKAIEGNYTDDLASGTWTWWDTDGQVTQTRALSQNGDTDNEEIVPAL